MEFKEQQLKNILEINPRMTLKKGTVTKKIAMEHLTEYVKQVKGYELSEFKSGSKFKNKDTLVARITPCLENGKTAYVDILADDEVAFGSTEFFVVRAKENKGDPQFIYYLMRHPKVRDATIKSMTGTSGRQRAQKEAILEYSMSLPNIFDQKKIGYFLSLFDSKIEANNDTIHNLEQLSQALFKQWFIDFEFPNEEGKPYKSSGGEMVESELEKIPLTWKIGKIDDIAIQKKAKINLDTSLEEFNYIGLEHMPQGNIGLNNWESSNKVSGNKSLFENGDILFGKLRPYFKKVGIAPVPGICSTDILVINSKIDYYKSYLFLQLIQDSFIKYTSNTATGTRMPRTSWKLISNYEIILPNKEVIIKFDEIISPILEKVNHLIHENNNLQQLRDTLLPKLLSGEIEIPDDLEV